MMMSNRFWTFQTLKRNAKDNHGMTPSNRNQSRPISSSINYKLPEKFSLSIVYLMIPKPLFQRHFWAQNFYSSKINYPKAKAEGIFMVLGHKELQRGRIWLLKCDILPSETKLSQCRLRMSLDYEEKRGYKKTFDLLTILIKSHPMFCHAHDGPKKATRRHKKQQFSLGRNQAF